MVKTNTVMFYGYVAVIAARSILFLAVSCFKENHKGVTFCDTPGGKQQLTIIDEAGLYSLVMRAKTDKAEAFQEWVISEVLPAIRKHGGYLTADKIEQALTDPDTIIKLAITLKEERAARQQAESNLQAAKPKVLFADARR